MYQFQRWKPVLPINCHLSLFKQIHLACGTLLFLLPKPTIWLNLEDLAPRYTWKLLMPAAMNTSFGSLCTRFDGETPSWININMIWPARKVEKGMSLVPTPTPLKQLRRLICCASALFIRLVVAERYRESPPKALVSCLILMILVEIEVTRGTIELIPPVRIIKRIETRITGIQRITQWPRGLARYLLRRGWPIETIRIVAVRSLLA